MQAHVRFGSFEISINPRDQGLNLVADYELKDGSRVGSKLLVTFTRGFVDALYAKILIVEETDSEGKTIKRERRRYANAAMTACRRAWFVGMRAQEKIVPSVNPFANMGLKTRMPGQAQRAPRPRRGKNSQRSETKLRNSAMARWLPQLSPHGNGCSAKSIYSEHLRSNTTAQPNGRIAYMSCIPKPARTRGGLSLMKEADRYSRNS